MNYNTMDKPKFNIGDHCIIFKTFTIEWDDGEITECYDDNIGDEVIIIPHPETPDLYDINKMYEVKNITKKYVQYVPEELLKLKEE